MLANFINQSATVFSAIDHETSRRLGALLSSVDLANVNNIGEDNAGKVIEQPDALQHINGLRKESSHLLAQDVIVFAPKLLWTNARLSHDQPTSFIGDYCFTEIIGPDGKIFDERFRFGVYLQTPNTFYPLHKHEAEEIYFPIAGAANWQRGNQDLKSINIGNLIHHPNYLPHATQTKEQPLLALWAWFGNLSKQTYSFVTDPQ